MNITLRKFSTRTGGKTTALASMEANSKGEFTVRDGQVVIQTLPAAEKAAATVLYEALRRRLMIGRNPELIED